MKKIQFLKQNGEIVYQTQFKWLVNEEIKLLNDGYHTIVFDKPIRSIKQHKLMWLWFNCIAQHTGSTSLELYQYFCLKYNYQNCSYDKDGKFSGGTSKLKTKAFSIFLSHIEAEALIEFHCLLPSLENEYLDLFINEYE